jgi:hypothetical protein
MVVRISTPNQPTQHQPGRCEYLSTWRSEYPLLTNLSTINQVGASTYQHGGQNIHYGTNQLTKHQLGRYLSTWWSDYPLSIILPNMKTVGTYQHASMMFMIKWAHMNLLLKHKNAMCPEENLNWKDKLPQYQPELATLILRLWMHYSLKHVD